MKKLIALFIFLSLTSCMSVQDYFSVVIPQGRVAFEQHMGCPHVDALCGRVEVVLSNDPAAITIAPEQYPVINPQWLLVMDSTGQPVAWRIADLIADATDTAFWLAQDLQIKYIPSQLNGTPFWRRQVKGADIQLVTTGAIVPTTCTAVP